jgi:3',5'-cyclic AMP phosphodiesterase CpdA
VAVEIIHISDIHLGQRNLSWAQRAIKMHKAQPEAYQALRHAVAKLLERPAPQTIAILSGDLTIIGGIKEIGDALDEWNTLTGGQKAWVLGNHDFWNGKVLRTAARHQTVHHKVRTAYWPLGRVTNVNDGRMRVSIYELDSTPQEGLRGLYTNVVACGELSKTQIDELHEQIANNGTWTNGSDVVLAIMHHPLGDQFRDSLQVLAWLRERPGPVMIMSGHTHLWAYTAPGFMQATCGSSTFESRDGGSPKRMRPPSFLVHRLEQNGSHGVVLHRSVWEFDGTEFQPLPARAVPGPHRLLP